MSAPITITATLKAWSTGNYSLRSLMDALQKGDQQEAAENMVFSNADMDNGSEPWARIGDAEVTVRLCSKDEMVAGQLACLQKELEAERAKFLDRQQKILEQISKLQALTCEVPA